MRTGPHVRRRFLVEGIVQGVGFRPFVYGLAEHFRLSGFVLNDVRGVLIEVEGPAERVERFRRSLSREHPPLAVIDRVRETDVPTEDTGGFEIRESREAGPRSTGVAPDVATCDACLEEISSAGGRRHRYAFTNCTNCGPRFTISRAVPYDRANTTMASFDMCADCKSEYEDVRDRRFHAQPIACPQCGPTIRLTDREGEPVAGDAIQGAADRIAAGAIVAVKGMGGYHLACDASNQRSVEELRRRKRREEKPFALMAPGLDWAARLGEVGPAEAALLASRRRPIVLLRRRETEVVAAAVAPGNRYLGIMLPYTPLHHLLMEEIGRPIVLTSGNPSDEPIAYRDEDAYDRLGGIADAFLTHDRDIHMRCDDSVVRVMEGDDYPIRRSRGYAPESLVVTERFARPVLAAGPELKHTFCLGTGDRAILSQHIGDLETWEAMTAFLEGVAHFERVFDVAPEVVAYDVHPEYLSTKWAKSLQGVELVGVQHHHAHIVSCLADNGRSDRVIGLALDGTGFGDDGAIWGCEVLVSDAGHYERITHLRYVPLPGGAAAIREPWRMAAVYLTEAFGDDAPELDIEFVRRTRPRWGPILRIAEVGINSPETSSAGRLFDAVAALCGVRDRVTYEGQAAAELEQLVDPSVDRVYPCSLTSRGLDGVELVAAAAEDLAGGRAPSEVAAAFHNGLAAALVRAGRSVRDAAGLSTVALSGGTFQNAVLLKRVRAGLERAGFEVLVHRRVPPNDGGISLGQAVVANALAG